MRLKEQKFGKEEDYEVIKFIMRLCKEELYEFKQSNAFTYRKLRDLAKNCKTSRSTHSAETQLINYSYWPGDSGLAWPTCLHMVYLAMLIGNYYRKFSDNEKTNIKNFFLERLYNTMKSNGKIEMGVFDEHFPIICKALGKICPKESINIMKSVVPNIGSLKDLPLLKKINLNIKKTLTKKYFQY